MTYCQERTKLLQAAGRELAVRLLPAPFQLWYSSHDTGCQMTIVAPRPQREALKVWQGSIWYSAIYEFNDRGDIPGLQPDFEFARPVIDSYFDALKAEVGARAQQRAKDAADRELAAVCERRAAIEAIRRQVA